jgi:2-hydroxychromene-2-carboxylate isomerase
VPLANTIRSFFMRRIADPRLRDRRRAAAEAARRKAGLPHEVLYFHQPDDPYSHLAAQALTAFVARYDIQLQPRVVAQPTPIAIHEQELWDQWARRECGAIAPYYGLEYRDTGHAPSASLTDLARRILVAAEAAPEFAQIAVATGNALNSGDPSVLGELAARHGAAEAGVAEARLQENFRLRHKLGHYLGAMFHYAGEWYWGIDRLHHLEARLDALGARRPDGPQGASVEMTPRYATKSVAIRGGRRVALEFFPSLRSPYTHLSYARVADLVKRYPIDLVVRPVLPMMMRGVKADRRKGVYILQDTRRAAERLGVAFGNIWDPFGDPVRRAYSLFALARERGKALEYLHVYSNAVWSERVNAWSLAGLRSVVERAGLSWDEARSRLDNREWEPEMERNVADMIAAGSGACRRFACPPPALIPSSPSGDRTASGSWKKRSRAGWAQPDDAAHEGGAPDTAQARLPRLGSTPRGPARDGRERRRKIRLAGAVDDRRGRSRESQSPAGL